MPSTAPVDFRRKSEDEFSEDIQSKYEEVLHELHSRASSASAATDFSIPIAVARFNFAESLRRRGQWTRAADQYLLAIELDPAEVRAYLSAAPLLVFTDRVDDYLELCQELQQHFGLEGHSRDLVGVLQWDAHPDFSWKRLGQLEEARSLDGSVTTIQSCVAGINKGICSYRSGDYASAVESLAKHKDSISYDFNPVRAHIFLAMALARLGKQSEAEAALKRAAMLVTGDRRLRQGVSSPDRHPRYVVLRQEANNVLEMMSAEPEPDSQGASPTKEVKESGR